jgi:hypothetical protein
LPAAPEARVLPKANALPLALSDDFQFRKTKIYFLDPAGLTSGTVRSSRRTPGTTQDASISFERQYRLFGAITGLDQRQRFGDYYDFFWRAKRPANITVRFEYRQEKLRSFVQAREVSYPETHGTVKTEFAIVGDDYFDDGRVIAWRCLLIENGRIVGLTRSYMWE